MSLGIRRVFLRFAEIFILKNYLFSVRGKFQTEIFVPDKARFPQLYCRITRECNDGRGENFPLKPTIVRLPSAIAHHWYSGDHFGELKAFYERYPEKYNVASEGCCAIVGEGIQPERELAFAERYAHDILGCFKNGLSAYCDWNITLDEKNGPYHNRTGRGCSAEAPVYSNKQTGELVFRSAYYYIGHISKFVKRGAKVINSSSYTEKLDYCAFKNPDGEIILPVMNSKDKGFNLIIRLDGYIYKTNIPAHSIATFIINK